MRSTFFLFVALLPLLSAAQSDFRCIVRDSTSGEPLFGVAVNVDRTSTGAVTDPSGQCGIDNIVPGKHSLSFRLVGYFPKETEFNFGDGEHVVTSILLAPNQALLSEVIVSSTRTNSRIDDLNTKVEVLGQEEMDEESELVPGSVTSILGDLSVITIQRTNPINGNEAIRLQGMDPKYTQLMRDGIPLYGGFSGSLGVLSIPPLDLKQVEIIKGSASTLYGGGAIGGLINFISKEPVDTPQHIVSLNYTTQQELNSNSFFSGKFGKIGYTLFTGYNDKSAYDVNKDGFAEVPKHDNFTVHPRIFMDLSETSTLKLGWNTSLDHRAGGDLVAIQHGADSAHPFVHTENGNRHTADLEFAKRCTDNNRLTIKSAYTIFDRNIRQPGFYFTGLQHSSYLEANDLLHAGKHTLVIGGNFITEDFNHPRSDSTLLQSYTYYTAGGFIQDDWQLTGRLSMQTGLRVDHHSAFGNQVLPRISFFLKAADQLSIRLAGGSGYKIPNVFDVTDPSPGLLAITGNLKPEQSTGINADLNYHRLFSDELSIQVDQAFYYCSIDQANILVPDTSNRLRLANAGYRINSYGTDTYVRLKFDELEFYLGYNHTRAVKDSNTSFTYVAFNPIDKFSTTIAYDIEGKWRFGVEAAWNGRQYITGNLRVPNYWFMAAMAQRTLGRFSIVVNCENLLDKRQSRSEPLFTGSIQTPTFTPVWGPIEGRVVNLSVKYSW